MIATIVLSWVLILSSYNGGIIKIEDIESWEDCERLRKRAEHAADSYTRHKAIAGSCTQISKVVYTPTSQPPVAAPIINVAPPKVVLIERKQK